MKKIRHPNIKRKIKNIPPVVMTLSGHDPTGGAGIQADIEAITAMKCHATSVITCLTVQNSCKVYDILPLDANYILRQARAVLRDMPISVFKLGLLGSIEIVNALQRLLKQYAHIPVVFDPVLAAGSGKEFSNKNLISAIRKKLLPLVTILTPNTIEARRLAGLSKTDPLLHCADILLKKGVKHLFITGTHTKTELVHNILYSTTDGVKRFRWKRLPHEYHGSGCTLAAAIAAIMATENDITKILKRAQKYTWRSLEQGRQIGGGQQIPQRINSAFYFNSTTPPP